MLAFRLRPPLKSFHSRAYSTPSFLKKPPLARPYLWWTKARYRPDGSRRSILLGILHGAFYVSVTVYAYRQYHAIKDREPFIEELSAVVEMQRISRKYRTSTFTEPAEMKAYISEMAKVQIIPERVQVFSEFCEEYEALSKILPENCEKIRESICELKELLEFRAEAIRRCGFREKITVSDVTLEVHKACHDLSLEMTRMLIVLTRKRIEEPKEMYDHFTKK